MADLKLKRVCELTGVSRRAIQGYEKAGLVTHTGKNERGHLLYDTEVLDRIELIRLLQLSGMSLKEIQLVIDEPKTVLSQALRDCIDRLKRKQTETDTIIQKVNEVIESLKD